MLSIDLILTVLWLAQPEAFMYEILYSFPSCHLNLTSFDLNSFFETFFFRDFLLKPPLQFTHTIPIPDLRLGSLKSAMGLYSLHLSQCLVFPSLVFFIVSSIRSAISFLCCEILIAVLFENVCFNCLSKYFIGFSLITNLFNLINITP